ncbi:hypothetical protein MRB53_039874 [Persea americana]|nr:hypothetical protein MRB53_039874 [Persea americana]
MSRMPRANLMSSDESKPTVLCSVEQRRGLGRSERREPEQWLYGASAAHLECIRAQSVVWGRINNNNLEA